MMARPSIVIWVLLLAFTGFNVTAAETRCVVCQNLITAKFYWMSGPALPEKVGPTTRTSRASSEMSSGCRNLSKRS